MSLGPLRYLDCWPLMARQASQRCALLGLPMRPLSMVPQYLCLTWSVHSFGWAAGVSRCVFRCPERVVVVDTLDAIFFGFGITATTADDLRTGVFAVVDGCLSYELPMVNVLVLQLQVSYKEWLMVNRGRQVRFLVVCQVQAGSQL